MELIHVTCFAYKLDEKLAYQYPCRTPAQTKNRISKYLDNDNFQEPVDGSVYGDYIKYGSMFNPTSATDVYLVEALDISGIKAYTSHFCIQARFFLDQGPYDEDDRMLLFCCSNEHFLLTSFASIKLND